MGCAQWEGDLRNTVADGGGGENEKVLSGAPTAAPLWVSSSFKSGWGCWSSLHAPPDTLGQRLSISREYQSHPEVLLKHRWLGRDRELERPSLQGTDAAGPRPTLQDPLANILRSVSLTHLPHYS